VALLVGAMLVMIGMQGFTDSAPSNSTVAIGGGVIAAGLVLLGLALK
jgi:hypothetical protein